MIHIVFDSNNVTALQKAIELDESLQGDVIEIKDDYMVGPLANIYETEGYQERRDWWKNLLEFSPYEDQTNIVDDKLAVHQLIRTLEENETEKVWIWMGQNAHDVCGYYWLMPQLRAFQGRLEVLYLNNLPFINEKGNIFYPIYLHEIQPKEFLKAKKLARPITLSEFELDPDEWKKTCSENAGVRFLEGGKKIVGKPAEFFDADLLQNITGEFQKLNKVLSNTLNKMKVKTGDVYLVWRLIELGKLGKLEVQGDWSKGWKEITVKMAGAKATETITDAN
ncbi:MAG: hypothetical protein CFE25_15150 [Chitinophagaceae bacterium BSSC1]|nr:MAG: hypothetical protein CFE25_15150 [Chitinophagaceae bacterium BSSC1]